MELSIDTSTRYASIAISCEGIILRELSWSSKRNHSVELVSAITTLLNLQGITINDLKVIITTKGPGAFSALRVGMSTAKSMAFALSIPIVGISSMDVEVVPYCNFHKQVIGLIPAGKTRMYIATYDNCIDTGDLRVEDTDFILNNLNEEYLYCGEGIALIELQLKNNSRLKYVRNQNPTRRMSTLANLGFDKVKESDFDDLALLEPIYVRASQIDSADRMLNK